MSVRFSPKIEAVKELAEEISAIYIPIDAICKKALKVNMSPIGLKIVPIQLKH